ncbi:hypothetical protein E4U30_004676 [Claviceps sp. LM220 group G6]|nr:hypothetical protein E4U30_004676 [Claviceps sp. LM220 group G6]
MTDDQRDALQPISLTQWFDLPIGAMDNPQKHFLPIHELPELDAIFVEASRINHNCENNAQHYWKDDIKRLTVHALRDIHPGEEITTSYGSFPYSQKLRQVMFEANFGFKCSCRLCSLPDDQMQKSDMKVAQPPRTEQSTKASQKSKWRDAKRAVTRGEIGQTEGKGSAT